MTVVSLMRRKNQAVSIKVGRIIRDIRADLRAALHISADDQLLARAVDGHPGRAEMPLELVVRRQALARPQARVDDPLANRRDDHVLRDAIARRMALRGSFQKQLSDLFREMKK